MVVEKSKDNWKQQQQPVEPNSGSAITLDQRQTFPTKKTTSDDDDNDNDKASPCRAVVPVVSPEKGPKRANNSTSDQKPAAVVFNDKGSQGKVNAEEQGNDSSSQHDGVDSKRESSTVESAGKRKAKNECIITGEEADKVARGSKSARTQETASVVTAAFANNRATVRAAVVNLSLSQEKYLETMRKTMEKREIDKPTANFCLLKALYVSSEEILSKQDLKKHAETFYGKPLEPIPPLLDSPGYGAWSGIETLVKHELVKQQQRGSEHYFSLTAGGRSFCTKLFTAEKKTPAPAAATGKSLKQGDIRTFFLTKR